MAILAVMVRYYTPLSESETMRGMSAALSASNELRNAYRLLVWDNSPRPCAPQTLNVPFLYKWSRRNVGVSGAFNGAMQYALTHHYEWMLLLDQDTQVTDVFLQAMMQWSRRLASVRDIALVAPTVRVGSSIVSPRRYRFNYHRAYPEPTPGVAAGNPFAINSGCMVRTEALHAIGGFDLDFWLDYSDIEICHRFHVNGYRLWRATDAELQHEMSVKDYDRLMTPERYTNYSYAETAFNDLCKGRCENIAQTLRLLLRAARQRLRYNNPTFSRITLSQFMYRLRVSRGERIQRFLASAQTRRSLYALELSTSEPFIEHAPERKAV